MGFHSFDYFLWFVTGAIILWNLFCSYRLPHTSRRRAALTWLLCCRATNVLPSEVAEHIARYYIMPLYRAYHPVCGCRVERVSNRSVWMHVKALMTNDCEREHDVIFVFKTVYIIGKNGTMANRLWIDDYETFNCCLKPNVIEVERYNLWKCLTCNKEMGRE